VQSSTKLPATHSLLEPRLSGSRRPQPGRLARYHGSAPASAAPCTYELSELCTLHLQPQAKGGGEGTIGGG